MNSVYGFTGTGENGMLPCKPIGESVTAKGRMMIQKT
jgi:DNA polymerase elongation subunit (family B)